MAGPQIRANNLPAQLAGFIGREREIAQVKTALTQTRLLTLTGTGGIGKTRLALRVAADVMERYPDGVWLADLAPIADPALVPKTVASALNVPEQPRREMTETLMGVLQHKALLLVVDNCEHVLAACRDLTVVLLQKCSNVRLLATSREGLGVPGETLWRVPSLSVPEDPHHLQRPQDLVRYDAVRLFIDRAIAASSGFVVTRENAPAVAQICRRLDGIPLAIELAAARVKVLAVEQIAARLDDRFRLLTGGSRAALARHQTLRAAIDWSYNLLSESERAFLRRLAVFAGGWTLEAAEAICVGGAEEADQVLDLLTSLVDKSLVTVELDRNEARYRLLETLRQYARDELVESQEGAEVQKRHRSWYLDLAERAEAGIEGPADTVWLNRLEVEHDNLRAAMGWSTTEKDDSETRLRLAATLNWFWECHTHWSEGRRWLETALAASRSFKSSARVKALWGCGNLAWMQGDYAKALALCDESLALGRELEDQPGIARALMWRGLVAMRQEDFEAATALFEESLELSRKLGDKWFAAAVLSQMGAMARLRGDYAKAASLCEESLGMFRTLGGPRWIAYALRLTAHAVRLQGNLHSSAGLYREGLELLRSTSDKWVATECIEGLAIIAGMEGELEKAARLFGAAEAARETFGITTPRPERGNLRDVAAVRAGAEDGTFAVASAEGRAMTLERAIEYALALTEAPRRKREDRGKSATGKRASLLAPREQAVAALIVEGKTNREIAAELSITESTAETHVQHILNKLGFNSRAQVAAWAALHGLRRPS